jgi:signal transduction histidine kinase
VVNLSCLVRRDLGCLDMSKASVSLRDVTQEVLATCQVQARRQDVQLSLRGSDEPHATLADRDALSALLKNVINNAIKFSRAGGEVVVSLKRTAGDCVVTVVDSGCGIAAQDLPHVFEPFYRGRNAIAAGAEGSGLGLAVVKAVTEAHGGWVRLDSEEGEGTSVTIRLPAEESSPHAS